MFWKKLDRVENSEALRDISTWAILNSWCGTLCLEAIPHLITKEIFMQSVASSLNYFPIWESDLEQNTTWLISRKEVVGMTIDVNKAVMAGALLPFPTKTYAGCAWTLIRFIFEDSYRIFCAEDLNS